MARKPRKRPITEAFLDAEASYGRARQRIRTMAAEIGSFRRSLNDDVPSFIENHIQNLEVDITRHFKELEKLEEEYKCSKAQICRFIQEKLLQHESFLYFLQGFNDSTGDCFLPMLDQGPETTCSIKQMIANFAGVPTGQALGDFFDLERTICSSPGQRARANLADWPSSTSAARNSPYASEDAPP